MSTLGSLLLLSVTLALLVPACVVVLECLMAYRYPNAADRGQQACDAKIRTTVVIPAHDEAATIEKTLAALAGQLSPQDHVLVVADNCSDATAELAARAGALVLSRADPARRGKGYALDFAIRHLERDPPDVVLFLDADCQLSNGGLRRLAQLAFAGERPVQARYQMMDTGIASFAWLVRGTVRPIGLAAMGLPCQLYGSGMAFPWPALRGVSLASGSIVEDMKLTLDLIDDGPLPMFCNNARVTSALPAAEQAREAQRTRWEHGHLASLFARGIPTLIRALKARDGARVMLALDVCVPPLGLLFLLLLAVSIASALVIPFAPIALAGLLALSASLLAAWSRFGREILSARAILGVPAYLTGKSRLYLKFITDRQKQWNRTDRQ